MRHASAATRSAISRARDASSVMTCTSQGLPMASNEPIQPDSPASRRTLRSRTELEAELSNDCLHAGVEVEIAEHTDIRARAGLSGLLIELCAQAPVAELARPAVLEAERHAVECGQAIVR